VGLALGGDRFVVGPQAGARMVGPERPLGLPVVTEARFTARDVMLTARMPGDDPDFRYEVQLPDGLLGHVQVSESVTHRDDAEQWIADQLNELAAQGDLTSLLLKLRDITGKRGTLRLDIAHPQ